MRLVVVRDVVRGYQNKGTGLCVSGTMDGRVQEHAPQRHVHLS